MESSIRKNKIFAICIAVIVVLAGVLVVNIVSDIRRQLFLKQTRNDLKWVALALHSYHDTHGRFPPAVIRDGKGIGFGGTTKCTRRDVRMLPNQEFQKLYGKVKSSITSSDGYVFTAPVGQPIGVSVFIAEDESLDCPSRPFQSHFQDEVPDHPEDNLDDFAHAKLS